MARDIQETAGAPLGESPAPGPSRRRTVFSLTLYLVGFAVINAFWHYLTTGKWLDVSAGAYGLGLQTALSDTFLEPLSVLTHPWMILVTALVLAVIFFVPIVIAVLHHELIALLFVLITAGLGHATVLAFFQAVGCVLAARIRLRGDMPIGAALVGMTPVGLYLYVFAFTVMDYPAALPLQRWVLCAPVAIAAAVAILGAATVLTLSRISRFRSWALGPVLAILVAAPMVIFYTRVGSDELDYALIADSLAGPDAFFEPVPRRQWRKENQAQGLNDRTLRNRVVEDLELRKHLIEQRCEAFFARHGASDRAAAVLWVKAQVQGHTLDEAAYAGGLVRSCAAFASEVSAQSWLDLVERHPGAPHAALARWRLAELALRRRDVGSARKLLESASERLKALLADAATRAKYDEPERVFQDPLAVPAQRGYEYYENALVAVERLLWLMDENAVDSDARASEALAACLALDPHSLSYAEDLGRLAGAFEGSLMGDNLKLAVAQATADPYQRAEMLIALAENKVTDAAIEANVALGLLTMKTGQARALALIDKLREPEQYFKAVIAARENPWQHRCATWLAWLAAQPKPQD